MNTLLKLTACLVFAWVFSLETFCLLYDFGYVPLVRLLPPFVLVIVACSFALRLCLKATPGTDTHTSLGWVIALCGIFTAIHIWIAVEIARKLLTG